MKKFVLTATYLCFLLLHTLPAVAAASAPCFIIRVIDRETRRGVPMVELTTTSKIRYYTDSNGIICFEEPTLMDQVVYFDLFSHGYEKPGNGVYLKTVPGTTDTIEIERINIAERLYRITGQDIYGESFRAGLPVPIRRQALNGRVTGQDTFIETLYRGKIYWFWGDTFGPATFNGLVSGAVSDLPGQGGLNPETGIDLQYFVDSAGLNKAMCDIPGPGLVWVDWLAPLPDEKGRERLFAKYTRVKDLGEAYERGIAVFDDSASVFRSVRRIDAWLDKTHSSGHPVRIQSGGYTYLYIFDRYGLERVPADHRSLLDPRSYERFTCLEPGTTFDDTVRVEREDGNAVVYAWKANTEALSPRQQDRLMDSGLLAEDEGWFNPTDMASGKKLDLNPVSVFWNTCRKRWIMIAYEFCGQVWFLEGDTPTGPWIYARKIVAHDQYDFYNVGQHPLFDQDGGRIIYFEGTYTMGFSGNPNPTPLYDYNQMMYRLSLDDKRLTLPVPVYRLAGATQRASYAARETVDSLGLWPEVEEIPFLALPGNRKPDGLVPVYLDQANGKYNLRTDADGGTETPLFYALPMERNAEQMISGTWDCEADGYPFILEIRLQEDSLHVIPEDQSLVVESSMMQGDSIRVIIRDSTERETYVLTFQVNTGNLAGRYEALGTRESGKVTGEKRDNWLDGLYASPAVVPLYEYRTAEGEYYYTTHADSQTGKRSEKPLCRVWRNPTSILALDGTAKPVSPGEYRVGGQK